MEITNYFLLGDKNNNLSFDMSGKVNIPTMEDGKQYEVSIGIDASTTSTGVTIGLTNHDAPFVFLEYKRQSKDTVNSYLNGMMEHLVIQVINANDLVVNHIFLEDTYIDAKKFSKKAQDSLSTVKIVTDDIPIMIENICNCKKPKLTRIPPQTWRKYYLGDANTNKDRKYMKALVAQYGIHKYELHPQTGYIPDDVTDSIGIYSAGIISVVKPDSASSTYAEVILNDLCWIHKLEKKTFYCPSHLNPVEIIFDKDPTAKARAEKYGFKVFDYYNGVSYEKNLRSLTTNSNGVFMCVLSNSDMEAVPIYYENKKIPNKNETVIIYGYREIPKGGL